MPGPVRFDFTFGSGPRSSARRDDAPFRILVLGDFSGRESRGVQAAEDLARRPIVGVDLDTFDRVLGRFQPALRLGPATGAANDTIEFATLDDFHPDRLYARLRAFAALRDTRARLKDPVTFEQAASELRAKAPPGTTERRSSTTQVDESAGTAGDDAATLERLLGRSPANVSGTTQRGTQRVDVQALIRDLVAPHIVQDSTPFQAQYVAAVDAAIGEAVRALLHHPSFQSLESNWLGIRWLVNTLDLDEAVRLELLDVSRDELRADLHAAQGELDRSGLARALLSRSSGEDHVPWSLLIGHFAFGASEEDIALLAALGAIAQQVGAPWIAAAQATLLGCTSLVQTPEPMDWKPLAGEAAGRWRKLRESPMAAWIGLAHPRVLLRLPYGPATDEIELFEFDELAAARDHESLLWGNPAIVCALLLGQSFMSSGWDMEPGDEVEIDDLPALIVDREGEKRLQPCAEVLLSDRAAQAILQTGVMPLLGFRNRNAARLMRFQSIAHPPQPLAGPWTR